MASKIQLLDRQVLLDGCSLIFNSLGFILKETFCQIAPRSCLGLRSSQLTTIARLSLNLGHLYLERPCWLPHLLDEHKVHVRHVHLQQSCVLSELSCATGAVAGDSWNQAKTCQFYLSRVVSQPVPSWSHAGTSVKHCQSCNEDHSKGPYLPKIAVPLEYSVQLKGG